jgi:hypothetical protein
MIRAQRASGTKSMPADAGIMATIRDIVISLYEISNKPTVPFGTFLASGGYYQIA